VLFEQRSKGDSNIPHFIKDKSTQSKSMKKLLAILGLFLLPLLIFGQKERAHIEYAKTFDSTATVTLNIVAENKKQATSVDLIQSLLPQAIENQTVVSKELVNTLSSTGQAISAYTQEIEKHNKDDSQLVTDKFKFSTQRVQQAIRVERWLNFSTLFLTIIVAFAVWWLRAPFAGSLGSITFKLAFYTALTALSYYVTLKLLTLLFNGDYYVIKELTHLYT
jgi:hypothetical protein